MPDTLIAFIIGLIVGGIFGMFAMSIFIIASDADSEMERRNKNDGKRGT